MRVYNIMRTSSLRLILTFQYTYIYIYIYIYMTYIVRYVNTKANVLRHKFKLAKFVVGCITQHGSYMGM